MAETKSKKKIIIISVVAVILVAAIILGIIFIPKLFKKPEEIPTEKFIQIVEKYTDKPVVDVVCDDFDGDGNYEAFAVVGKKADKYKGYYTFYQAELYFINYKEKVQLIRSDLWGVINGVITSGNVKHISIEFYYPGDSGGRSYFYTAKGEKVAESNLSGEYVSIRQDEDVLIGKDKNLERIQLELNVVAKAGDRTKNDPADKKPPVMSSVKIINEPTQADFDQFEYINRLFLYGADFKSFDYDSADALETAYGILSTDEVECFYGCFFDSSYITFGMDDPLGQFGEKSYKRIWADEFDWILQHVFNVTPDRNNTHDGYYIDDYCYFAKTTEYGENEYCTAVEDYDFQPIGDGKFKVTVTNSYYYPIDGVDPCFDSTYIASLKEVDGKRVWSIYNFDIGDIESVRGW